MTETDRMRWNERYRANGYDFTVPGWLSQMENVLRDYPQGARALDLACGGGRNALYLAELGYTVDAWDISDVALDFLRAELARRAANCERQVAAPSDRKVAPRTEPASTDDGQPPAAHAGPPPASRSGHPCAAQPTAQALAVYPRRVDLEQMPLPLADATYDLILDAHYLQRSLFDGLKGALRPGGRLIVHTFLSVPGGPNTSRLSNPSYALAPGELRQLFADVDILDLVEDTVIETAHLLAQRPT